MLSLQEKIYVIQCYGIGEYSLREVVRMFNLKYPNSVLLKSTAMRIIKKFLKTGSVQNIKKKKKIYDQDDAAAIIAIDSVQENPKTSLRKRSSNINISKSQLQRIYKANNVRPFKPTFIHTLQQIDEGRRLDFCLSVGEKIIERYNFHHKIIFSDESTFTTNGVVSSQNCRFWADRNPNFKINCRNQYYKNVNVWCAVSYDHGVIGPYFIEGMLNKNSYLALLEIFWLIYR